MATLLMNLRNVPQDEADDVRAMLNHHYIDFYETPQNRFGISAAAIWIKDRDQVDHARRLLREYQENRARKAQAEYLARKREGTSDTLWSKLRENPAQFILYVVLSIGLIYLIVRPFFDFGGA